ncbi:MAG: hypothetical protein IJW46_04660 [Clostridia bacterium]|nr:hypothetical protein [Clostridia bacterium]
MPLFCAPLDQEGAGGYEKSKCSPNAVVIAAKQESKPNACTANAYT